MKKYEAPIVELTKFDVEDVITASGGGTTAPTTVDVTAAGVDTAAAAADIANNPASGLDGAFSWK